MKNVCMVAYTFYEADNRVRRYAEALAQRGDHVDAIALLRDGQKSFEKCRGVNVYRIQKRLIDEKGPFTYLKKLLLFFIRSAWLLTLHHLENPYDIIHVHSVPDFQVFAAVIPRLLGARIILDIHDIVPEFYASKFSVSEKSFVFRGLLFAEKVSTAFSNHVIISNHLWEGKITKRAVYPEKCTTIINYPDLAIFSSPKSKSQAHDEFVMCYPGTLNRHQGVDVLIDALVLLRDHEPRVRLLVIGDGPDRERLKSMVRKNHLEDRVELRGFVSIEKVAEAMRSVDLGVVPKRSASFGNEAFSTKIMEFMAMGVPVIASRTRIDQFYFNEHLLQFFESDNAHDLAEKISYLVQHQEQCELLCKCSSEFIALNNWDVKRHEYFSLVDSLAENGHMARNKNTQSEVQREMFSETLKYHTK